jgi:hypothetical protein
MAAEGMMRETILVRDEDEQARILVTDERGTQVLDGEEELLAEYPEDRHAALLAALLAEGWEVESDGP